MGFSTDAIHVGQEPDPLTGSIVAPIYQTSTYVLEEMGKDKGYDYARTNHPNRKALERTVAKLEGGHAAYVFTSGMAAIDAVFRLLRPGEHTILSQAVYGGVFRLTTKLLVDFGMEFSYVDTSCLKKIEEAIKPNTRMIYVETPTNPTMIVTDLAAVGRICKARNLTFVVDNTFLSPYLQRPIEFGADIVVHSMTKYLNGHSDCTGGAAILTRPADAEKIYQDLVAHPSVFVSKPVALMAFADHYRQAKNFGEAAKLYTQIKTEFPDSNLAQQAGQQLELIAPKS